MPYETGADELKYQSEYARKRKAGGDKRAVWDRVIARAEGTAPSRESSAKAVKGGGNVTAPNKASNATRLQKVFEGLTGTSKIKKPLDAVAKKARPKP